MSIITICGSSRFKNDILNIYKQLTLQNNIVFLDAIFNQNTLNLTIEEKNIIDNNHKQQILLSDKIFVVNKGGYIGVSTMSEIEFAKEHNKEILYLEN